MADTLINYIKKYGDYTFAEKALNDVDSLVLCQFSYLKFDYMIPGTVENRKPVSLRSLPEFESFNGLFTDERYGRENRALFDAMLHSKRYRNLKLNYYINIVEKEWETQFSAVTFFPEGESPYIAYRGTDENIIGWKEDFNMVFQSPVPCQAYAKKYLHLIAEKLVGSFYVGGHSKGGNVAVYAAMNSPKELQDRILKIYSMDGPGFRKEVLEREKYEVIKDRIVKILPKSSVVGMLFETSPNYKVVASKQIGILQHDPYSWLVDGDDFLYVKDVNHTRKVFDRMFDEWIDGLEEAERREFVNTLYQVISASEAENLIEFSADWKKSMNGMLGAYKNMDEDAKKMLKNNIKALFEVVRENIKFKFYDKKE